MTTNQIRTTMKWTATAIGAAAGAYGASFGAAWLQYGHPPRPRWGYTDPLLDHFMPRFDVVERHRIYVAAPADVTYQVACDQDLFGVPLVRAIFKARELVLGGDGDTKPRPRGLIAQTLSIGWGMLAEVPNREVVMGAVTQPWLANVVFRALPPDEFASFAEPDYVKIVWTLRARPIGASESLFFTETRAIATDAAARAKFRWYWARFSPGIRLIRRLSLGPVRREAERRSGRRSVES